MHFKVKVSKSAVDYVAVYDDKVEVDMGEWEDEHPYCGMIDEVLCEECGEEIDVKEFVDDVSKKEIFFVGD